MAAERAVLQGLACFGVKSGKGQRFPLIAMKDLGCSPLLNEF